MISKHDISLTLAEAGRILSRWRGKPTSCTRIEPLRGGMVYSVARLDFDEPPFRAVVKLSGDVQDAGLAREHRTIQYLRDGLGVHCLETYLHDDSRATVPYDFVLLEHVPGINLQDAPVPVQDRAVIERELAVALLELHRHTRETFGGIDDPVGHARWTDYFIPKIVELAVELRPEIDERLRERPEMVHDMDRAIEAARTVLDVASTPVLVHGDVWEGNIMVEHRADGWHLAGLLDWPACHYADVEYELAYLEVFRTGREAFFDAYTQERSLRPGYEFRRCFYWLHTYLVHIWCFREDEYFWLAGGTASMIAQRLSDVRA